MKILVQASLQALEVLLERIAPTASPLIRRLPANEGAHAHVQMLLDFLMHVDPPPSVRGGGSTAPSCHIATSEVLFGVESAAGSVAISRADSAGGGDSQFTGTNYDGTIPEGSRETSSALMSTAVGAGHRVSDTSTVTDGLESRAELPKALPLAGPRGDPAWAAVRTGTPSEPPSAHHTPKTQNTMFETALSEVMATPRGVHSQCEHMSRHFSVHSASRSLAKHGISCDSFCGRRARDLSRVL
jgi:hypothetical protein